MDLNLLVALDVLLREGSVTAAAHRLHLSVPAMSRTLGRIRKALGDPVLVRSGRGLVPTPRALAMQGRVRAVVEQAQVLLSFGAELEPSTMERTFAVLANDWVVAAVGARLLAAVRERAPHVVLRFLAEGHEDTAGLREGTVDAEIGVIGQTGTEIRTASLVTQRLLGVVSAGHPLATGRMTLRRFAGGAHLSVSRRGRLHGPVDQALAERGLRRQVVASAPSFTAALSLLRAGDLVGMMPELYADSVAAGFGLHVFEIPLELEPVHIQLAWHHRFDADPAHSWLRERIREVHRTAASTSAASASSRKPPGK